MEVPPVRYAKDLSQCKDLLCGLCCKPANEPVQSTCPSECLFCQACAKPALKRSRVCPTCTQPVSSLLRARKNICKALDALEVYCPNYALGCTAVVPRNHVPIHMQNCAYQQRTSSSPTRNATSSRTTESIRDNGKIDKSRRVVAGYGGVIKQNEVDVKKLKKEVIEALESKESQNAANVNGLRNEIHLFREEMQETIRGIVEAQRKEDVKESEREEQLRQERNNLEQQLAIQRQEIQVLGALVQSYEKEQKAKGPLIPAENMESPMERANSVKFDCPDYDDDFDEEEEVCIPSKPTNRTATVPCVTSLAFLNPPSHSF